MIVTDVLLLSCAETGEPAVSGCALWGVGNSCICNCSPLGPSSMLVEVEIGCLHPLLRSWRLPSTISVFDIPWPLKFSINLRVVVRASGVFLYRDLQLFLTGVMDYT